MLQQHQANAAYRQQIGKRIRQAREFRGYSVENVGAIVGGHKLLMEIEDGQVDVSLTQLRQLAQQLDAPICFLLGESDLLEWFDERQFLRQYRLLAPTVRRHLQGLVSDLIEGVVISNP